MSVPKQGRIDLRLPLDLVNDIKAFARKQGTTVTKMVEEYFHKVLEADALKQNEEDVEQI